MEKPLLIASDVDGTLLDAFERLTPRTASVVRRATEEGVPVVRGFHIEDINQVELHPWARTAPNRKGYPWRSCITCCNNKNWYHHPPRTDRIGAHKSAARRKLSIVEFIGLGGRGHLYSRTMSHSRSVVVRLFSKCD